MKQTNLEENKNEITAEIENKIINPITIGDGSYAKVYKYYDKHYDKMFALKRARVELNAKELERFKREFDEMKKTNSPYVLEVYAYNSNKNEYYMELMDSSIYKYIEKNNSKIGLVERINIIRQFLKGINYLHCKGYLHRDINPKNALIRNYDDTCVVKICDFGLVKVPDSTLTTFDTEYKGWFNDPILKIEGFKNYRLEHEIYSITIMIFFILTGKTNINKINDSLLKAFVAKGTNPDIKMRFKDIKDINDNLPFNVQVLNESKKDKPISLSSEERSKITDQLEEIAEDIVSCDAEDSFGNYYRRQTFEIDKLMDIEDTKDFLVNLEVILNQYIFVTKINPSLLFRKYVKVKDNDLLETKALFKLVEFYNMFMDKYQVYSDQFIFAICSIINKNFSQAFADELPF